MRETNIISPAPPVLAIPGQGFMLGPGLINSVPPQASSNVSGSANANVVVCHQFVSPITLRITKVSIWVQTGVNGTIENFGLYDAPGTGKLLDVSFITDLAHATATQTITVPALILQANRVYWYAYSGSGAAGGTKFYGMSGSGTNINLLMNAVSIRRGVSSNAMVAGVLPSSLQAVNNQSVADYPWALFEP